MMDLFLVDSLCHANGSRGADQAAEVAADALGADDTGLTKPPPDLPRRWEAFFCVEGDGLMTTVHARYVAAATADT